MNAGGIITPDVTGNLTALRLALHANGFHPVPISSPDAAGKSAGKRPLLLNWREVCASADEATIRSWQVTQARCTNTGLLTGSLIGVDADILAPELAERMASLAEETLGWTPLVRIGRAPKWLRCYRVEAPLRKSETPELVLPDGTMAQVEVLGAGQQFVSHGIHPDTRQAYSWPESTPQGLAMDEVPVVTEDALRAFLVAAEAMLRAAGGRPEKENVDALGAAPPVRAAAAAASATGKTQGGARYGEFFRTVNTAALANIAAWLPAIFPRAELQAGTGAWRVSSKDLGRQLEEDISVHPDGAQDFGTRRGCSPVNIVLEHGGAPDAKTAAFWLCEKLGKRPADLGWEEKRQHQHARTEHAAPSSDGGARPPQFSDDGLALEFSSRHVGQLLYVATWGHWLRWDGTKWAADTTLAVYDLSRAVCREMGALAEAEDPKRGEAIARDVTSSGTVASVERMARSDRRHARAAEQFDADPWVLNTTSGVVDLRTGRMRPHRRDDLFTKVTGTTPESRLPWRWLRFLLQITHGDKKMVRYLQRFIGYTLTGVIDEHAFAFLCGPGGNGKSVLLSTVAAMLGDY
ncbi:MAG: hypothetical protein ACRYHQ_05330, partial [Janthinobacterium lividum]